MTQILLAAIIVMIFVVIFQIAKASEYVNVLKGEEKARKQNNKINAFLLISFLILGLIGVVWCNEMFYHKTLFAQPAASDHGEKIDQMLLHHYRCNGCGFCSYADIAFILVCF